MGDTRSVDYSSYELLRRRPAPQGKQAYVTEFTD